MRDRAATVAEPCNATCRGHRKGNSQEPQCRVQGRHCGQGSRDPTDEESSSQERPAVVNEAIQRGSEAIRDLRVLIIDDVWETGITMRRVASVLIEMGASHVRALAMTRTK